MVCLDGLVWAFLMALHGALKTAELLTWPLRAPIKYKKEAGRHYHFLEPSLRNCIALLLRAMQKLDIVS